MLVRCPRGTPARGPERVQGSGDMVSEPREVQGFDRVRFDAFGEMEIVQGEQEGLVIEAQPNLLTYITTEVRGDQLVIGIKPHISVTPLPTIRYQLSVKDLRDLEVSGAGLERMRLSISSRIRLVVMTVGNLLI